MKHSQPLQLLMLALTTLSAGSVMAASADSLRPRVSPTPPAPPAAIIDPSSEQAPPPFEITGPESLDIAVEKAKAIDHPAYKEKLRYHRSTHISFPLPRIDGQDMSQASVSDSLNLKGRTEAEKKADLEKLVSQLAQGPHKLDTTAESSSPASTAPTGTVDLPGAGPRARINISVAGH